MRWLLVALLLAVAGCPKSGSSSSANSVPPAADWPDAAPMPDFREQIADAAPSTADAGERDGVGLR